MHCLKRIVLAALMAAALAATAASQQNPGVPQAVAPGVPNDLRPLLAPRRSEMRLVTTRYTADRNLLTTNFAGSASGGGRGGGGRGQAGPAGPAGPAPLVISPNRIARLKRFDISWQAALDRIDTSKISAEGRAEIQELRNTIQRNTRELDTQAEALAQAVPLIPFAPDLMSLIEARIAIKDIDSEKAAGVLTKVTREITTLQAQLTSGAMQASPDQALSAASGVDQLKQNLGNWHAFYNGYDPLFTWWMEVPFKKVDAALVAYATHLRNNVAPANQTSNLKTAPLRVDPAPAPRFSEVPDLNEILALPQDEMTDIVQRFRANSAAGARGAPDNAPARDAAFYTEWVAALNTLEFDTLTRNAQVDYLFIKKRAELEMSRLNKPLPRNNPRKTDNSGIPGVARGREGLIRDLEDEFIPYTPEQLIVLANREFAWCEAEMRKAAREMGFGDDWKMALEKT
jgi:hypothetical protein